MGPSIGTLLATGSIALLTVLLSPEQFVQWGWRVPFFASVMLVGFGLWIRLGVPETPPFRELESRGAKAHAPVGEIFRNHWRALLRVGGARVGPDVFYSLIAVFTLSYMTAQLSVSRTLALVALAIGGACNAVCIFLFGSLSDRYGRRAVYGGGVLASLLWTAVLFPLLDARTTILIVLAISGGLILHAAMYGPQAAYIAEQFPTRVRYAGCSLAYTLAGVFGGGIAPMMFATLLRAYGTTSAIVSYTMVALVITGCVLIFARRPD